MEKVSGLGLQLFKRGKGDSMIGCPRQEPGQSPPPVANQAKATRSACYGHALPFPALIRFCILELTKPITLELFTSFKLLEQGWVRDPGPGV